MATLTNSPQYVWASHSHGLTLHNPPHSHPITTSAHTHSIGAMRKRQPRVIIGADEGHKAGYRIPVIEQKLFMLMLKANKAHENVQHLFKYLGGDEAIEVLGDYNPMYSGRPKKLAQLLLEGAAGRIKFNSGMFACGLSYKTPILIGVRKHGLRTSEAGMRLLDHWTSKFPAFAPFAAAYMSKKGRAQITSECVDFYLGHLPKSYIDAEKKNELYKMKWEAREYRRMVKERDRMHKNDMIALLQQQQMQAQSVYQAALNQNLFTGSSANNLNQGVAYPAATAATIQQSNSIFGTIKNKLGV